LATTRIREGIEADLEKSGRWDPGAACAVELKCKSGEPRKADKGEPLTRTTYTAGDAIATPAKAAIARLKIVSPKATPARNPVAEEPLFIVAARFLALRMNLLAFQLHWELETYT